MTSKGLIDAIAPFDINNEESKGKVTAESPAKINENEKEDKNVNASSKIEAAEKSATAKTNLGPKQIQVLKDLNWLLREGAVIAFGDGKIELAKAKIPKINKEQTKSINESSETKGNKKSNQDL